MRFIRFSTLGLVLALAGCQRGPYVATTRFAPATSQPVSKTQPEDPTAAATIAPYHDKVTAQMNEVLGTAPVAMPKTTGESSLGNFVADLQRQRASTALGQPVDMGVITSGALRNGLSAGPVTLGSVFEMMPFENELVVLDVPGPVVQQLFDYAARVKMAISGATYSITLDGQVANIRIGGQAFDGNMDRLWTIAISDYLASGGDNMAFLRPITPRHTNILVRTAIADHVRQLTKEGKPVAGQIEGRVKVN